MVPPNSVMVVTARLSAPSQHDFVLIPSQDLPLLPAFVVVSGASGEIPVSLVNDTDHHITLSTGEFLGSLEEVDAVFMDKDGCNADSV